MYTNLPTSQGYSFRILQHFATKLCSFSNFDNFFPEISFVISKNFFFLKRKSSIVKRLKRKCASRAQNNGQSTVSDLAGHLTGHMHMMKTSPKAPYSSNWMINRDYFTVGECVRFLFTSCDGSLNERVSAANE